MLNLLIAWMLVLAPAPVTNADLTPCPADHPDSRKLVNLYLTLQGFSADRSALGLYNTSTSSVRILSDATDAAVCQSFADQIATSGSGPGWQWTAYQVGSYYFVAFRRADTAPHMGHVPLYIFTTGMQQVRGITM